MSTGKIVLSRKIFIRSVRFRKTAATTEESDEEKDSFYRVFCRFSKYNTKTQFENSNAKLRRELVFQSMESENSNANESDKSGTAVSLS